MFVEVYAVKTNEFMKDAEISKVPENRRLIELTGARLRPYPNNLDKCEITLPNGVQLICAGSYDEVTARIGNYLSCDTIVSH